MVPGQKVRVKMDDKEYETSLMCDLIHPGRAKVLAKYSNEFYAGTAAITENKYGKGKAWYIGTKLHHQGLTQILNHIILQANVESVIRNGAGLEITKRITDNGQSLYFVLNMSKKKQELPSELRDYQDLLTEKKARQKIERWDVQILISK